MVYRLGWLTLGLFWWIQTLNCRPTSWDINQPFRGNVGVIIGVSVWSAWRWVWHWLLSDIPLVFSAHFLSPIYSSHSVPEYQKLNWWTVTSVWSVSIHDMNDPNFPVNLDIHPLHLQPTSDSSTSTSIEDIWKQRDAIKQYGIAGRIWYVNHYLVVVRPRMADYQGSKSRFTRVLYSLINPIQPTMLYLQ